MKPIPTISHYMSTTPLVIDGNATLEQASKLMKSNHIRHLPVMNGEKLTGIVTDRDLKAVTGLEGVDVRTTRVQQISTLDPLVVDASTKLDHVCGLMAENKFGCVVIQDNKKIVGIFTWIDALLAMQELLGTRLKG